jgi:hypothetical protein
MSASISKYNLKEKKDFIGNSYDHAITSYFPALNSDNTQTSEVKANMAKISLRTSHFVRLRINNPG